MKMLQGMMVLALLLSLGPADLAWAHDDKHDQHHRKETGKVANAGAVDLKLLDLKLVNQNGDPVRFKRDVIADKIIVMDFIYTSCTTICPVLSALMAQVQRRLGDRVGAEVRLVSISVDPTTDTPGRLKAYARKVGAKPGWTFLTGYKPTVDRLLTALEVYTPDFEDHPAIVLVGDGHTGSWSRFYGFPSPDQTIARVHELLAARQGGRSASVR